MLRVIELFLLSSSFFFLMNSRDKNSDTSMNKTKHCIRMYFKPSATYVGKEGLAKEGSGKERKRRNGRDAQGEGKETFGALETFY